MSTLSFCAAILIPRARTPSLAHETAERFSAPADRASSPIPTPPRLFLRLRSASDSSPQPPRRPPLSP
jgi:hypothetical protein